MDASTAAILARGQQFQGEAAARHIAREFYTTIPEAVAWCVTSICTFHQLYHQFVTDMATHCGCTRGAGGYVIGKLFENSREICSKQPNSEQCKQANLLSIGSLGFIGGFATIRFIGHRIFNDTAPPLQSASFHISSAPGLAPIAAEKGNNGSKLDKHWAL